MMALHKESESGQARHGWLQTWNSFSIADYHDPSLAHFTNQRVTNEELFQPDSSLGMHSHRDMEIFTYNLKGELCHQGSMGGREQVRAGDALMNIDEQHVDHSAGSNAEVLLFNLA